MLVMKKWDVTELRIQKSSYTWTINNFSYLNKKAGEYLKSPDFAIGDEEPCWNLRLYPNGINRDYYKDYISIYLCKNTSKSTFECQCSIAILNNKLEIYSKMKENYTYDSSYYSHGFPNFIKKNEVNDEDNKLLIGDSLTVHCEIGIVLGVFDTSYEENKPEFVNKNISISFEKFFLNGKFSDVKLLTSNGKELYAHKNILSIRSPIFSAMFEHDMIENQLNFVTITDINYDTLKEMLRFIYANKVENVEKLACELLTAADKYGIDDLKAMCKKYLYENMSTNNVIETLIVANNHNVEDLKNHALRFIKVHVENIIDSSAFQAITQVDVLKDIIQAFSDNKLFF